MSKIAIVGTGRMGTAFAKRLLETGNEVTVWNRSAKRTAAAAEAGAQVAQDLAEVVDCEVILHSVQLNFCNKTDFYLGSESFCLLL